MAKKKISKVAPKKKPVKSITKAVGKSISKSVSKISSKLTKKIAAMTSKAPKKPAKVEKPKKIDKKLEKNVGKSVESKKNVVKPPVIKAALKSEQVVKEVLPKEDDKGDTLIEMARAEMAAVKIGQTAEKVEKASKFKAIKVERGNVADEKAKWQELNKRYGKDKAVNYKMTDTFESLKPVQHKVLGWGFVLTNDNDRLEVLFENGIKMLISNYKPN